jgi:hypothetical protein
MAQTEDDELTLEAVDLALTNLCQSLRTSRDDEWRAIVQRDIDRRLEQRHALLARDTVHGSRPDLNRVCPQ